MGAEIIIPASSNKINALASAKSTVSIAAAEKEATPSSSEIFETVPQPPYSALRPNQRRLFLGIVAVAGCFGPLAAGIYLPAIPVLQFAFHTSATAVNATVSVFLAVLAVGVSCTSSFIITPTP